MGLLDFLFGKKKKEEQPKAQPKAISNTSAQSAQNPTNSNQSQLQARPSAPTMEPFVFKSNCHQRFENGSEVMGLQQCIRTVSVEKNTNGCCGYKLNPGDGYIVKVFNDDLGKPNMSDKPMRIVNKTADKVELRGFPIEAQTPFGWQEVDYRDYGFTVYYSNGKVTKCVLHMFDRNIEIEYRKTESEHNSQTSMRVVPIESITKGVPFDFTFDVTVVKQFYDQTQEIIKFDCPIKAIMSRKSARAEVEIKFLDLSQLKSKGIIQSNLSLSPNFTYNRNADGDEFASAEINNSWSAIASGEEYISLFQITKQKGKVVSFLINNLPGDQDFYYLLMMHME